MRRALVGVLVLATACSLPLPGGVKSVGQVDTGVPQPGGVKVFPPVPQPGQDPRGVVAGFLRAQASSDDDHAIARAFLTDGAATLWDDAAEVQVYDAGTIGLAPSVVGSTATVTVTARVTGEVSKDGRYVAARRDVTEKYSLVDTSEGWRLSGVPEGLRLTAADLLRAYQPHDVYYVSTSRGPGDQPHLVPDRVFLPLSDDLAASLVRRALQSPSAGVSGSVTTAVPQGVQLRVRSVRRETDGVVAVDLAGPVSTFSALQKQELSARLVWTLRGDPGFRGLRLLAEGEPLSVPGAGAVQDAGAWDSYDPEGLGLDPPYFFVAGRRLRSSLPTLVASDVTTPDPKDGVGVDEVAVTTSRSQVAVLDRVRRTVYVGQLTGRDYRPVASGAGLSSLTWGSGAFGVWMLQAGVGVVRVDPAGGGLRRVTVLGQLPGPVSAVELSRDGSRAALVAGGRLFVAKVDVVSSGPRLVDPTEVLPRLGRAVQVAWATPTELVVIGSSAGSTSVLRVPVDGSTSTVVQTGALSPVDVAAAGRGLLVQAKDDRVDRVYLIGTSTTRVPGSGTAPAYPG